MTELVRSIGVHRSEVTIRTYPRDDEGFQDLVVERLRRFDRVRHLPAVPERLERLLEPEYPAVRCRYQDPLASETGAPLLYVFRDGAAVNPVPATAGSDGSDGSEATSVA